MASFNLIKAPFQIQAHPEVLGVRASTYEVWGEGNSSAHNCLKEDFL